MSTTDVYAEIRTAAREATLAGIREALDMLGSKIGAEAKPASAPAASKPGPKKAKRSSPLTDAVLLDVVRVSPGGVSILADALVARGVSATKRGIWKPLRRLVTMGRVVAEGSGRYTQYRLP